MNWQRLETDAVFKLANSWLSQLVAVVVFMAPATTTLGTDIISHRGNACGFTENSKQAVNAAWALGVDSIELDVRLSADGIVYLFHDDEIDRVAVNTMTYDSIKQLVGEHAVPKLASVLSVEPASGYYLLDLKQWSVATVPRLFEVVSLAGISQEKILLQSDSVAVLKRIQQALPAAQYYLLSRLKRRLPFFMPPNAERLADRLVQSKLDGVSLKGRQFIDRDYIDAFRKRGIRVNVWTINSLERAEFYRSIEVDGLITDKPVSMKSLYDRSEPGDSTCSINH